MRMRQPRRRKRASTARRPQCGRLERLNLDPGVGMPAATDALQRL